MGSPITLNKIANGRPMREPYCVNVRPRSRRIGTTSSDRIWRSMLLEMLANRSTATTYHAYRGTDGASVAPRVSGKPVVCCAGGVSESAFVR